MIRSITYYVAIVLCSSAHRSQSPSIKRKESHSRQVDDPVYDDATPTQPNYSSLGPTYDMETTNDHGLNTYDCIKNAINIPQAHPNNPTPVRDEDAGREDNFYDAEQHTYATVNKSSKKKKTSGNDEGDDNEQKAEAHDTPSNPIPASKKGDNFYEAEEHTYSVVKKKKAKKKISEDGEGEREGGEEGEY